MKQAELNLTFTKFQRTYKYCVYRAAYCRRSIDDNVLCMISVVDPKSDPDATLPLLMYLDSNPIRIRF